MNEPLISIIIPAKNAEATIKKCLDSILNLNYQHHEVFIINDGSSDKTGEILMSYKGIKIINTEGIGPSKARNIAVGQAEGEYVAFTDADCVVGKEWLNELLKGFAGKNMVSVGGSQKIPADESAFGRIVSEFMRKAGFITDYMRVDKKRINSVNHNASCNVMYKKDIFLQEGGFKDGLWPGEDVELDYRLEKKGYTLMFNPQAVVYHYRQDSFRNFIKMMFRYGWAQGVLVRQYGIFRRIQVLPVLNVALIAVFYIMFHYNLWIGIITILILILGISVYLRSALFLGLSGYLAWNRGWFFGLIGKRIYK